MPNAIDQSNSNYKLVAIDLDDTLLAEDLTISERNIEAIRRTIEKGVTVTIATGRMYASALPYARQLELDVPLITYQGALVKTSLSGEVLFERLLDAEVATELISFGRERGVHMQAYHNDTLFTQEENAEALAYSKLSGVPYQSADLQQVAKRGTPKVIYIADPVFLDEFQVEVKALVGSRANVFKSKPNFLEVTHPEASKGQALDFLANGLGITREQVIGMGDSYNDLDMLEYAGLGVAMGNAPEPVKRVADYVTAHHQEDGVAEALTRFILSV